MMWIAFFVSVLATAGNHIGKVFQKRGTDDLPRFSLHRDVLSAYVKNPYWLGGLIGDVSGAILTAVALALAPVSTVQPIISSGVIFLVLFSHFYLGERVSIREWIGVFVAIVGTVGVGITMTSGQDRLNLHAAFWMILGVVGLMVICEVLYRRSLWMEFATGLQAGVGFGLSSATMRAGMLLTQEHRHWIWAVLGVATSMLLSGFAFSLQTRGLKDGRAMAIGTYTNIFVLVSAVTIGLFALNEAMPSTTSGFSIRMTSFALIALGASLMAKK